MAEQLLSEGELKGIRETVEITLADRCQLLSRSNYPDGQGGYKITDSDDGYQIIYADVPCRIAERSGRESFLRDRVSVEGDWILTLPESQAVSEGMRVELDGLIYDVVLTNAHQSYRTAQRLLLRQFS